MTLDRRPSPRAYAVNLFAVWAWVLLWTFLAFVPTAFGAWDQWTFAKILGYLAALGVSLTASARRHRPRPSPTPGHTP